MSVRPETYFEIQAQLTTWTDELEFLGYILCELIDEDSLNTKGYRYHQAADLPATVEILRLQLKEPNGYLSKIMSEDELKLFRRLLRKAKDIRNLMAHHKIQNHERLKDLEDTKVKLSDMLEFAIKGAASDRGIYQIPWSPYYHICKTYMQIKGPLVVMVPLNEVPLLSFRDRVLHDYDLEQEKVLNRRPKRKATEEGRRKQKDDYEIALTKKQQRKERDMAMRIEHQSEKLGRINQRFIESQQLGHARLNKIKVWMKEEQELFYRQRAKIRKDGIIHPSAQEELLYIIILAISSPFWLTVILIYNIY